MTVGPKLQNWICHKHVTRKLFFCFFSLVAFKKNLMWLSYGEYIYYEVFITSTECNNAGSSGGEFEKLYRGALNYTNDYYNC